MAYTWLCQSLEVSLGGMGVLETLGSQGFCQEKKIALILGLSSTGISTLEAAQEKQKAESISFGPGRLFLFNPVPTASSPLRKGGASPGTQLDRQTAERPFCGSGTRPASCFLSCPVSFLSFHGYGELSHSELAIGLENLT